MSQPTSPPASRPASLIDARLAELGLILPEPSVPVASYTPWVRTGSLVVVSGQIPMLDGVIAVQGLVGVDVSVEEGQRAAQICFLNVLAHVRAACGGSLDRVCRVVRLGGFIAAPASFTQHAVVMNGASDLAQAIFGSAGQHARSTIGVPSLPRNAAVEVEGWFEVA